ncbi:hypothetical protein HaLaN_31925 [Haematococcus lacustris]|uniref:Uncharacterized protein n=1 Tax=Haematococcus lacustris TaxID=44745 RepID=A0A6A0AIE7_HAELA|nr:hypothetical protein HaLaN_31925 [Haematococcus lacustris]
MTRVRKEQRQQSNSLQGTAGGERYLRPRWDSLPMGRSRSRSRERRGGSGRKRCGLPYPCMLPIHYARSQRCHLRRSTACIAGGATAHFSITTPGTPAMPCHEHHPCLAFISSTVTGQQPLAVLAAGSIGVRSTRMKSALLLPLLQPNPFGPSSWQLWKKSVQEVVRVKVEQAMASEAVIKRIAARLREERGKLEAAVAAQVG